MTLRSGISGSRRPSGTVRRLFDARFSESFGAECDQPSWGLGGPRGGCRSCACGAASQAGEPRACAAALRRAAAVPQVPATVQLDAIATLMRRALIRTSAPIFNSLTQLEHLKPATD